MTKPRGDGWRSRLRPLRRTGASGPELEWLGVHAMHTMKRDLEVEDCF